MSKVHVSLPVNTLCMCVLDIDSLTLLCALAGLGYEEEQAPNCCTCSTVLVHAACHCKLAFPSCCLYNVIANW